MSSLVAHLVVKTSHWVYVALESSGTDRVVCVWVPLWALCSVFTCHPSFSSIVLLWCPHPVVSPEVQSFSSSSFKNLFSVHWPLHPHSTVQPIKWNFLISDTFSVLKSLVIFLYFLLKLIYSQCFWCKVIDIYIFFFRLVLFFNSFFFFSVKMSSHPS